MKFTDILYGDEGRRIECLPQKGFTGALLTSRIFSKLNEGGRPTHLLERVSADTLLVRWLEMIPLEVVVRGFAYGSMCIRYGLEEGQKLPFPFVEFFLKSDELGDPMIAKSCAEALGLASRVELDAIEELALYAWSTAESELARIDVELLDFKLEFGRLNGQIHLADEIGFDTVRLRDRHTLARLDKDVWYLKQPGVQDNLQLLLQKLAAWNQGLAA